MTLSTSSTPGFSFICVAHSKRLSASEFIRTRRVELGLSIRQAAKLSEGAITHSHWSLLESDDERWKKVQHDTVVGIARALEVSPDALWNVIRGRTPARSTTTEGVFELSKSDYVESIIVILSIDGNEIGERTVTVRRENASGKLYGFTNHHNTVHSIAPGQSVKVNSQKTFEIGDMVLVRASGQIILAYTQDTKASRVITAQGLELKTDKVWGKAFERLENDGDFKRPQMN
jgi:transcriptional regulator with XRE-family HTH domain